MTPGTSPRPRGTVAIRLGATLGAAREAGVRLAARAADLRFEGTRVARIAAVLYLAGLCIVLTTAWHDPAMGPDGVTFGLPTWHLAFLLFTGATATLLTVVRGASDDGTERAAEPATPTCSSGLNELVAQIGHEMRTPLNAVIGFSKVMQHELHGPLGNARYQEYAHHISESGGRLLKSSEEALAVTEAMTALMSDRRRRKRERLVAEALVRDAWPAATRMGANAASLETVRCNSCMIFAERRPVAQALEHLLREAAARVPAGGAVEVLGRRRGTKRSLEIRAGQEADVSQSATGASSADHGTDIAGSNLGVILARLLLESQSATLDCTLAEDGTWSALIEFTSKE
jgi:signal transduction histidine kinase